MTAPVQPPSEPPFRRSIANRDGNNRHPTIGTHPDGALPPALDQLHHAVNQLIHPQADGHGHTAPSLYTQLCAAAASPRHGQGHQPRSIPPLYLDAVDLRNEIDQRLALEQPGCTSTPHRLERIAARPWRPMDVHWLETFTNALNSWADDIETLLDPPPKPSMAAPCPNCDTATVHRKDSAGENVRQPALQFGPLGCTCMACRTTWPPERYELLAAVLKGTP
jgi:hypothetical protein